MKLPPATYIFQISTTTAPTAAAAARSVVTMTSLRPQRSAKDTSQRLEEDIGNMPDRLDDGRLKCGLRLRPDHPQYGEVEEGVAKHGCGPPDPKLDERPITEQPTVTPGNEEHLVSKAHNQSSCHSVLA